MKSRRPLSSGTARLAILAAIAAVIGAGFYFRAARQATADASTGTPAPGGASSGEISDSGTPPEKAPSQKASSRESEPRNLRTRANDDGTTDEFRRSANRKLMTRTTRSASGAVESQVIYHLSDEGKILNGEIFDAKGTKIAKANYGYSKKPGVTDGKLVEEQLFDAEHSAKDGEEMPARRLIYTYNADGSQNEPILIVLSSGYDAGATHAKSDGLPSIKPSALNGNPFADPDPAGLR